MLDCSSYLATMKDAGIGFFAGVPDSLLKQICACITEQEAPEDHIIAANEGAAVGLAIGYYLATQKLPVVYMQNSGLGNIINPIMSLASTEVYSIPMVLFIGWRGEPGVKDEPQHVHQGRLTEDMLNAMEIPITVLSSDPAEAETQTRAATKAAFDRNGPVAVLVRKGTFDTYKSATKAPVSDLTMEREEAVISAAKLSETNAAVVSTTGMISRELFEFRAGDDANHARDFLTVGGMGHASQIAMGIALKKPDRPVYCFDGDGAVLMHMGSLAISGTANLSNFTHIVFNNGVHESVGGQPTVGFNIDFPAIAAACGYKSVTCVKTDADFETAIKDAQNNDCASFIEVQVLPGHRADIGRPTKTPVENKTALVAFLSE